MTHRPLFQSGPAPDSMYVAVRDHRIWSDSRARLERLWVDYAPICADGPAQFLKGFQSQFVSRSWELYIAGALRSAGHHLIKPPRKGPDICIERGSHRIWVECVAPEPGTGPDAVDVRVGADRHTRGTDPNKVMLRITSALSEKVRKIGGYIDDGIVGPRDPVIIALTIAGIPHADVEEVELPLAVRAIFGIGDFYLAFQPGSDEPPTPGYFQQRQVRKASRALIETTGFIDRSMNVVSGNIFSSTDIGCAPPKIGADLGFVQNPQARVPVPRSLAHFRRTYFVKNGWLTARPPRPWGG